MKRLLAVLLVLMIATPSFAWNYTGHKAIGIIAYGLLTPATKRSLGTRITRSRRQELRQQAITGPELSECKQHYWVSGGPKLPLNRSHGRRRERNRKVFTRHTNTTYNF
jgi:hypothetical protein